jgi:hypothetical protein
MTNRRDFLKIAGAVSLLGCVTPDQAVAEAMKQIATTSRLPRWKGFNLLDFLLTSQIHRQRRSFQTHH